MIGTLQAATERTGDDRPALTLSAALCPDMPPSAARREPGSTATPAPGLMVLVDTSIWIRFLAGKQPYAAQLDELLERDEVSGHELVFGELSIGDRGGRSELLAAYAQIHQAPVVTHEEAVAFVRARRLHGRGAGWIDVHLLASAVVSNLQLWTADHDIATLAAELGAARS